MDITAAVLRQPGLTWQLETVQLENPRPDEIVVRIVSSGICHTDITAASNARDIVPVVYGHEGAGVVEVVGSEVRDLVPGDHVVLSFDSCNRCDNCLRGIPTYCREFRTRNFGLSRPDGTSALSANGERIRGHYFGQSSFATHVIAREHNAVKVSKDLPLELLGPLGCGVQTGAGSVLSTFGARPGSSLVVFGVGSVGLSAILGGVAAGCTTIIGVDIVQSRLDMAKAVGATHVINGRDGNISATVRDISRYGVNYAFDTTGVPALLDAALESLDELGVCGMVGGQRSGRIDIPLQLLTRGRSIRTIIEGDVVPSQFIPTMIDLWKLGRFPFDRMITEFPFESINEAAQASETGEVIKPVLRFD